MGLGRSRPALLACRPGSGLELWLWFSKHGGFTRWLKPTLRCNATSRIRWESRASPAASSASLRTSTFQTVRR
eukprot:5696357-Pyramimonas_sp.AAC.1